jgi:hypothetical protein
MPWPPGRRAVSTTACSQPSHGRLGCLDTGAIGEWAMGGDGDGRSITNAQRAQVLHQSQAVLLELFDAEQHPHQFALHRRVLVGELERLHFLRVDLARLQPLQQLFMQRIHALVTGRGPGYGERLPRGRPVPWRSDPGGSGSPGRPAQ